MAATGDDLIGLIHFGFRPLCRCCYRCSWKCFINRTAGGAKVGACGRGMCSRSSNRAALSRAQTDHRTAKQVSSNQRHQVDEEHLFIPAEVICQTVRRLSIRTSAGSMAEVSNLANDFINEFRGSSLSKSMTRLSGGIKFHNLVSRTDQGRRDALTKQIDPSEVLL